ncbi:MAG: hypothetical protein ACRYHQ_07405 [Janthinobacterium lividum]
MLRRLHMLNDWYAAGESGNGYTDSFAEPFLFEILRRGSHGFGAASAMINVAAPAAQAAKGATWMD